jgi:hypothetical protein
MHALTAKTTKNTKLRSRVFQRFPSYFPILLPKNYFHLLIATQRSQNFCIIRDRRENFGPDPSLNSLLGP